MTTNTTDTNALILAALQNLTGRLDALETRATSTATAQTAAEPGAVMREKSKTPPPPPDNRHPKYGTPVKPGTRVYPEPICGLMITRAEGRGDNGEWYAKRALLLLPNSNKTEYFASRSSSTGKPTDAEYLTDRPLYHIAEMVQRMGGKFYEEQEPGKPARVITHAEFLILLAESIAHVCNAPSVATYWRTRVNGPTTTPTKKGKAKA